MAETRERVEAVAVLIDIEAVSVGKVLSWAASVGLNNLLLVEVQSFFCGWC